MHEVHIVTRYDFIECFTTTFLRAHSWLNWVDVVTRYEYGITISLNNQVSGVENPAKPLVCESHLH